MMRGGELVSSSTGGRDSVHDTNNQQLLNNYSQAESGSIDSTTGNDIVGSASPSVHHHDQERLLMLPPATPGAMVVSSTTNRDDDPDDVVMYDDIEPSSASHVAPSPEHHDHVDQSHVDHYAMQGYVAYDGHPVAQNSLHNQQNLQMYLQQEAAYQSISSSAAAASTSYLSNHNHHQVQFQPAPQSELDAAVHQHYAAVHQHNSFHDDLMRRGSQR